MPRVISIGAQGFEYMRDNKCFYIDKTSFITQWWQSTDVVTLICRPRRFGKTLNLDTVRCFLSTDFAGRGEELFGGLNVWNSESMRKLQGTVPVIMLSFARVKQNDFQSMMNRINELIRREFDAHNYLLGWDGLTDGDRHFLSQVSDTMSQSTAASSLNVLCSMLKRFHGAAPAVLIDEYDTPMQEAWLGGFWNEAVGFMRDLMNSTFKTNTSLGRGLITGITRISKESIFSDLNNLQIVTTLTPKYEECFGFTEKEVFNALDEFGLSHTKELVKQWYDGFTFGEVGDIYNPWSITMYLDNKYFDTYWSNTSSNGLTSTLVQRGNTEIKQDFEILLKGGTIHKSIESEIVFSELGKKKNAIWALLLATGYLKTIDPIPLFVSDPREIKIINYETMQMFDRMVSAWFEDDSINYSAFTKALLAGDTKIATRYLNDITLACISNFDSGTHPSEHTQPERFYHGLVLGLLVELRGRYTVDSNRESGYGRYDVSLIPLHKQDDPALILEFKVFDPDDEDTLEDTLARAHTQITQKAYATSLVELGIPQDNIREYGIVFRGKKVLIG